MTILPESPPIATVRPRRPGPPPKVRRPCARCGDPAGAPNDNGYPARFDGARYGVDGEICYRCRRQLRRAGVVPPPARYGGAAGRAEIDRRIGAARAARSWAIAVGLGEPEAIRCVLDALDRLDAAGA